MSIYLLIDGYNVINAWKELKEIGKESLEDARNILIERMYEYHSYTGTKVIIVFDAYRVKGTKEKYENVKGIDVIFTKEHQTADSYIEKKVEELTGDRKNIVKVVTSDWAEQQAVLGSGGIRFTPRELQIELEIIRNKINKKMERDRIVKSPLRDRLDLKTLEALEKWRNEDY